MPESVRELREGSRGGEREGGKCNKPALFPSLSPSHDILLLSHTLLTLTPLQIFLPISSGYFGDKHRQLSAVVTLYDFRATSQNFTTDDTPPPTDQFSS